MRTGWDRLRYTVLYELLALGLSVPVAAWVLEAELSHTGVLGVVLTSAAAVWNLAYNYGFDLLERRWGGSAARRGLGLRLLHALGFEGGFAAVNLPLVAWWMSIPLWQALLLDLGFLGFFLVYTLVFTWLYDRMFPVPAGRAEPGWCEAGA